MVNYNLWKNGMAFIDNTLIEDFSTEGAVLCKGIFLDWLDPLRIGVDKLIQNPSVRQRSYTPEDGTASFFQDLVNWDRIPEFKEKSSAYSHSQHMKFSRLCHSAASSWSMWTCSPHPQQVQETISVLDSKTSST